MNQRARVLRNFLFLLFLFAVYMGLNLLTDAEVFYLHGISSLCYLTMGIALVLYLANRIIDQPLRRLLIAIGSMLAVWLALRTAKYLVFLERDDIARICWYMYYVPMLAVPQLYFMASLAVGRPRDEKLPKIWIATFAVTLVFMALVVTNDSHQLIFVFHPGFLHWSTDHSYGLAYWLMIGWHYLFFVISIGILFWKCRCTASRNLSWIPLAYAAFFIILLILEMLHLQSRYLGFKLYGFTEASCFLMSGYWILCVAIGLVPSNKGYDKLLTYASVAATIADANYDIIYRSSSAYELTPEQLAANGPLMPDKNTLIHRRRVSGGYAYWQTDMSELNDLNEKLEEAQEALIGESELLRMENELKEKMAQIEEKNRVYDLIAARVLPQSRRIERLSAEAKEKPETYGRNMKLTCIYAAYIKRLSNLMLQPVTEQMERRELQLAVAESVRYVKRAGIVARFDCDRAAARFPSRVLIDTYERFEKALELALPNLTALDVVLSGDCLKAVLEGAELELPPEPGMKLAAEDGATYLTLCFGEDGDAK